MSAFGVNNAFPNVKLLSLNVRGLNGEKKRQAIYNFIRKKKIDICFLQETYSSVECENVWKNEWGGEVELSHGTNHARGVMTLFRRGLDISIEERNVDAKGRYIWIKVVLQNHSVQLLNIYAPTVESEQIGFYKNINNLLVKNNASQAKVITGGDFNILMNPQLDRKGGKFCRTADYDKVMREIEGIMDRNNLCDIWRNRFPNTKRYTWRRQNPQIHSRLDLWLISDVCQDFCDEVDIIPSIRSDHSAITISLKGMSEQKGKGMWKINNSFLEESDFVRGITKYIKVWEDEASCLSSKRSRWEYMKYKIREFSVKYGKQKALRVRNDESEYDNKLKQLEEDLDRAKPESNEYEKILCDKREVEARLKDLEDYKIEGLILRSRAQWYEKGERSNNFFLSLATRNRKKTTMNKLKVGNEYTHDHQQILKAQAKFYEDLYSDSCSRKEEEFAQYLSDLPLPQLDTTMQSKCEGLLTPEECMAVLKTMKKGKSPGNDGISVEFYVKFWGLLGNLLVETINESYTEGELSNSQRQAVITLLDKGGDRTQLKNWRPISLLNTDYKIASKAIAERLKQTLPHLINENQVGYVKGRSIHDNIRILIDIMHYTKVNDIPGILLAIDFRKAFDCVNWRFLEATLRKFGFGNSFIRWTKVFYTNISSCIINNGHTSRYFPIYQGVRQGDPLSPYLFIIVAEVLACKILSDSVIKGISVNGNITKLLQYADDTNGLVSDLDSARRFLQVVEEFGDYSNLYMNKSKTQGMWLGKDRACKLKALNVTWPDEPLKLLGVYVSYDVEACNILNYDKKLVKCKNILNWWLSRNLTLIGRIQIVKTFIISQFLYVTNVLDMPDKYIKEVNSLIRNFVWRSKKSKLSQAVMCKEKIDGGLKMPDFNIMLKVSQIKWMTKLMAHKKSMCWKIFNEYLHQCHIKNVDVFTKSDFDISWICKKDTMPQFYVSVLKHWRDNVQTNTPKKAMLWYNRRIKMNGKPIYDEEFCKAGILYVNDVLDDSGKPLSFASCSEKGIGRHKWLDWLSLTQCVKKSGVHKSMKDNCNQHTCIEENNLSKMSSKSIYSNLLKDHYDNTVVKPGISKYLDSCENIEWDHVYQRIYSCTISSKLQEFQFKFLHDILVNNYWLYKWKISESNQCMLCNDAVDTIDHLMWKCTHVTPFWQEFLSFIQHKCSHTISKEEIYLGVENNLVSLLCIIAKQYVYQCMHYKSIPILRTFICKMMYVQKMEEVVFRNKNKLTEWHERWEPLLSSNVSY